jgi:hypothetical protein
MLSRALSLATVTLLIGCFSVKPTQAQAQNLEAGKSPSQIFAGTCNACHKSPRGLLKTVPAGSLPSFLRQHYTTSGEMASLLSAFLVSNGATDTRYVGTQAKQAKDGKPAEAGSTAVPDHIDRFGRRVHQVAPQEAAKPEPEPQQAVKPDAEGPQGRNAKRLARPGEAPTADGQTPAQSALERGPDGRKQKLGKRGKPGSEEPEAAKTDAAKTEGVKEEPAKGEAATDDKANDDKKRETAKDDGGKPEGTKPSGEDKSESAKIEAPKEQGGGETPALRADPVPPVTPAPSASPAVSAAVSSGAPEPSAGPSAPPAQPAPPPAVTASVPPPSPPIAPAGPPAPPISQ